MEQKTFWEKEKIADFQHFLLIPQLFKSLSNDKILVHSKFKAFADN